MDACDIYCDLYLRLSDIRKEEALDGREAKLKAEAARLGWIVRRVVIENDMTADGKPKPASAWKRKKITVIKADGSRVAELRTVRPKFRDVLDDLTSGRAQAMLAEDLDRACRDPRDLEDLLDACALHGASARSLSGSLTLTGGGTDAEKMTARIMVATANKSSADTARRVADARERLNGSTYQGGPRPYGYAAAQDTEKYQRTLLVVPDEKDILLQMAGDILDRDISLRAVARGLRERGVLSARGNTNWSARTVTEVLTKPAIAGLAVHKGVLKPAPWEAILDRDIWEKLRAKLEDPARRTSDRGNEPRWLLSGIALCGGCNDGTTVRATGARDRTFYTCREGYHLRRNARYADAWIAELVIERLSRPDAADLLRPPPPPEDGPDAAELRAEARRLRERKVAQMRLHTEGLIGDDDLAAGMRMIRDRLAGIDRQLARSDQPDPLAEFRGRPAVAVWESLDIARRRAVVKVLIERITILPVPAARRGPGFDPDSLEIQWRQVVILPPDT
jgi:DNA invertase Pin-like site-specific DNA recombinase